ncbi:MAG: hypothetical protein KKD21_04590 [Proteobacteria bacterium]|nr:hypothetical protein [Pseudomonadota bacterium]MBU1696309.1 hypothetical protein [Pseudomonadota bacterium]
MKFQKRWVFVTTFLIVLVINFYFWKAPKSFQNPVFAAQLQNISSGNPPGAVYKRSVEGDKKESVKEDEKKHSKKDTEKPEKVDNKVPTNEEQEEGDEYNA